jgi:hypothetical protein
MVWDAMVDWYGMLWWTGMGCYGGLVWDAMVDWYGMLWYAMVDWYGMLWWTGMGCYGGLVWDAMVDWYGMLWYQALRYQHPIPGCYGTRMIWYQHPWYGISTGQHPWYGSAAWISSMEQQRPDINQRAT